MLVTRQTELSFINNIYSLTVAGTSMETYASMHDKLASGGFSEARSLEFKRGLAWGEVKHSVTKAALALSNLEGGGYIVIGIDDDRRDGHILTGMDKEASQTFREDEVSEFVNKYADPPVQIKVRKIAHNELYFIVITIPEFDHQPILCKKDLDKDGKKYLESGRLYYRPSGGIKSTARLTHQDLRDLLDLAVIKHHKYWTKQIRKLGVSIGEASVGEASVGEASHSSVFDSEVDNF